MRFYFLVGLQAVLMCMLSFAVKGQNENIILVIDPGHGGTDPGKPKGSKNLKHEKDINLAISLRLGEYIHQNLPQVKVLYTRTTDKFVSLEDRGRFCQ